MALKSWTNLSENCPIDISRVINYAKNCESYIPFAVNLENLDKAKEDIFNARACFNSLLVALMQVLYNREILQKSEDKIMYAWLTDNLGRFMKRLDDEEFNVIVKNDSAQKESLIGVSRIASYSKSLKSAVDSIIYETIFKANKEYRNFKQTDKLKKTPRTYLYILFQIFQVSLAVLGGLTRETSGINKRGMIQSMPTSWQSLMMPNGQNVIRQDWKKDNNLEDDDLDMFEDELIDGEDKNV